MSGDELFDIVDPQDRVIGQERRSHVHSQNLWHRAVHVLILNSKGEIFLQKRSPLKDMNPNVWVTSCSGHVDAGEEYDFAAKRELGEELGLNPAPAIQRLFKLEASPETGWEFVWVYEGRSEGPFTMPPEEISEGRFLSRNQIQEWIQRAPEDFAPSFLYLWKKYTAG